MTRPLRRIALALAVVALARPILGSDTMTPFDVARLRGVTSVAISPDWSTT